MVVLGGSCSAISPPCHNDKVNDDDLGGRYSNMVQRALQEAFDNFSSNSTTKTTTTPQLEIEVINRAQGYTTTSWNALLLDQLVDPNTTDILVWEFSINDFGGRGAPREYQIRLQFWFTQVQRLFRGRNEKKPPPVILLYLWEPNQNTKCKSQQPNNNATHFLKHGLGPTIIWREQQAIVKKLSQQYNWNIQVITVGATLEPHLMATYGNNNNMAKSGLTTDGLHPGCMGNILISNMIQHVLYSDLVQCPCTTTQHSQPMIGLDSTNTTTPTSSCESLPAEPPSQSTANIDGTTTESDATTADNVDVSSLQSLLYEAPPNAPVRTGSLSRWIPNAGHGITALRFLGNISSNDGFLHLNSKVRPGRIDRKISYALPLCEETNTSTNTTKTNKLEFTLLEPHLQWLGFAYSTDNHIMLNSPTVDNYATIRINDIPVFPRRNAAAKSGPWINHWVKVNTTISATFPSDTNKNYTISACRKHADLEFYMHAMVAVLYQESSIPTVLS